MIIYYYSIMFCFSSGINSVIISLNAETGRFWHMSDSNILK